jgi:YaiO family outer membrane protein
MTRAHLLIGAMTIGSAAISPAANRPRINPVDPSLLLSTQYTHFTDGFGKRRQTGAHYSVDFGKTAFTIGASQTKRTFATETFKAVELSGTLYHDWNDRIYTRTSAAISADKPVYASRQIANDFNFKVMPQAILTVGGKYARYFGNRDVLSWSAGGSYYFGGGFASYRFTAYDVDKLGSSHSHLATFRVNDPRGSGQTQLWLGAGTSLHEQEVLLSGQKGSYKSVALQRIQPVSGDLSLSLTLGRTWYDTTNDYRGTNASIGLNYRGLDVFGASPK